MKLLVAYEGETMVAFAMYQYNLLKDDWFLTIDTGFIREIFVMEKYGETEIARALIEKIEQDLLKQEVYITMVTANKRLSFFKQLGYQEIKGAHAANQEVVLIKQL